MTPRILVKRITIYGRVVDPHSRQLIVEDLSISHGKEQLEVGVGIISGSRLLPGPLSLRFEPAFLRHAVSNT